MPRTFGSLSAYEPGLMDKARWLLQDTLTPVMGGDARRAGDFVQNKVMPTAEYLPGVGDAMAAGDAVDYFRQGQPIFGTLAAAGAAAGLVPGVGDAVQKGVKKGIRAYHGSPHDFDKFSLDKIGTGEGAQAYGHGLYFAESEGVAKSYRDDLSKSAYSNPNRTAHRAMFADAVPENQEVADRIVDLINLHNKTPEEAVRLVGIGKNKEYVTQNKDALTKVANNIKAAIDNPNPGRMYEVNINADPDDFLDYDAGISDDVKAKLGIPEKYKTVRSAMEYLGERDWSGGVMSNADYGAAMQSAARQLKEAGIPGIKYLDAGSRGALTANFVDASGSKFSPPDLPGLEGQRYRDAFSALESARGEYKDARDLMGETYAPFFDDMERRGVKLSPEGNTRNYVVFDDALIEILRKYGLAGLGIGVGAGGFGSLAPQDDNYQPPQL